MSVSEFFQFVIMLTAVIALVYQIVKDHHTKSSYFLHRKIRNTAQRPIWRCFLNITNMEKPLTVRYSL